MKKLVKVAIAFSMMVCIMPFNFVHAQEVDDAQLKERLLSYGLYSVIDDEVYTSKDNSGLSYADLKESIRLDIIEKLNSTEYDMIVWDPSFVLELAPLEFPDLYPLLYDALLEQGYQENGIVAELNIQQNKEARSISTYATPYKATRYYTYVASGHGTVLSTENTIEWTYSAGTYNISAISCNRTGGWGVPNKSYTIRYNRTANAYGFFSYTALKDAYSYSAYLQLQMLPQANGGATLKVLSQGVNAIGIGF